MFVLIFCDFCGFISIAYTTLNKLLAVFLADRTNGRAYATVLRLLSSSVVCL